MKTAYPYTIKTINEKNTIVTVDGADVEVPIVSGNYDIDETNMTADEKLAARALGRQSFLVALKQYMADYLRGKDVQVAVAKSVPAWLKALETKTYNMVVNDLNAE